MKTINITKLREEIFNVVDNVSRKNEEILITIRGEKEVVLMSKEEYDALQETIYLLEQPGMKEKLLQGKEEKIEDCKELNWDEL